MSFSPDEMIRTPTGLLPTVEVVKAFKQCGFQPPAGMPLQDAFVLFMRLVEEQSRFFKQPRVPRGRTAVRCPLEAVPRILQRFGASLAPVEPFGMEVQGVNCAKELPPELAGALEVQMAHSGFLLFRGQGALRNESGVEGRYLSGEQQCAFTEAFGEGELNSTHGVHGRSPCRDVFRLSNDPEQGFNQVGPEWHNDGSFCREVFGHVVYHIVKAPKGRGDTCFAHLGAAYDLLPEAEQERWVRCASVNSNGGVVHPLVFDHPISGRRSLFLHTGMTGAMLERRDPESVHAWTPPELDRLMRDFSGLLERPELCYRHQWREGDVVAIDNLAVAHRAAPAAHELSAGLRILHRTTGKGAGVLEPNPELQLPTVVDTSEPCPFDKDAVWVHGYVGFRWGDWQKRTVPH